MNIWAIQQNTTMDGQDVSCLVAITFLEYANIDLGIVDYHHIAAYFGSTIKQNYCTKFPIDETSRHSLTKDAQYYANHSNDHRIMDNQQMYTYKLAVEAWHCLLQLNGSSINPPPSCTSTIQIPIVINHPNSHCPL